MHAPREHLATSEQYYRVTGASFRALCPESSGHMNMGLWPAPTLRAAQEGLVALALAHATSIFGERHDTPRAILDLGCGWGAARAVFQSSFPGVPYTGVSSAEEQIDAARELNALIPRTEYVCARVEEVGRLPWAQADLVTSIEAAFHFANKRELLGAAARHGARALVLAELCVEDPSVARDPLLVPSLRHAWSCAEYDRACVDAGFGRPRVDDIAPQVLPGFLAHLASIDEATYLGRRAILKQLRRATAALVEAAERGAVRYVVIRAEA